MTTFHILAGAEDFRARPVVRWIARGEEPYGRIGGVVDHERSEPTTVEETRIIVSLPARSSTAPPA